MHETSKQDPARIWSLRNCEESCRNRVNGNEQLLNSMKSVLLPGKTTISELESGQLNGWMRTFPGPFLYMASLKAYKLIKPKYKLPGVSTLRERCTRIILQPGIVKPTTSGDQFHYIGEGFVYAETTLNADAIRVLHNVQKCSDLKYAPKLTDVPRKYHWPHSYCQIKWPLGFSIYGIIRT